jgi:RNA polymerase sigma-70 factor (ECF subfamily)
MHALSEVSARSDATLVAAYRSGDEAAAAELVTRHGGALGRYLYAAGAAVSDVEDLVQEAFFRAFRALDGWRGDASFRGWLFRIGANLRKDHYRKNAGRVHVSIEDHDIADRTDPLGEAGAADMEERLRRGLIGLPRLQREVFLLRAQQGMDYQEICRVLGTTPGAARVHYHHAVKKLKELME